MFEHVGALRGQHFRGEPADDVGPGGPGDGQPTLANSQVPQAWWNGRWPLVLWNILTSLFQMTTGAVLKYLLEGCLNIRVLCYSLYEDQVFVPLLLPYFLFTHMCPTSLSRMMRMLLLFVDHDVFI